MGEQENREQEEDRWIIEFRDKIFIGIFIIILSYIVAEHGNFYYLCCVINIRLMNEYKLNVMLLDEASEFLRSLPEKPRKKILYNIQRVERGEVDIKLFEKLNDTIWEFRTIYNNTKYRLLSFWDVEQRALIIATHGFTKKTQKNSSQRNC